MMLKNDKDLNPVMKLIAFLVLGQMQLNDSPNADSPEITNNKQTKMNYTKDSNDVIHVKPHSQTSNTFRTGRIRKEFLDDKELGLKPLLENEFTKYNILDEQARIQFFTNAWDKIPKSKLIQFGLLIGRFAVTNDYTKLKQLALHQCSIQVRKALSDWNKSEIIEIMNDGHTASKLTATTLLWYYIAEWAEQKERTAA